MNKKTLLATCFFVLLTITFGYKFLNSTTDPTKVEGSRAKEPAYNSHGLQPPYPLPVRAAHSLEQLAAQSDVLVLGEVHGTQEVPAVVAAMLTPLTKLGYGVLAVEIPSDQQLHLTAWATGKTATVPSFFLKPGMDGRGNIQILTLIRTALSAPFRWHLVCFDDTEAAQQRAYEELKKKLGLDGGPSSTLLTDVRLPDAETVDWTQRDATMASNLTSQSQPFVTHAKVLAICGNLHARTANHSPPDDPVGSLWPSFAAVLQSTHVGWHVNSVNIRSHSGGFFNNGKVNAINGSPLDEVQVRPTHDSDWNTELHLPRATPATFFSSPAEPPARPSGHGN